jgi:hypothetical protein
METLPTNPEKDPKGAIFNEDEDADNRPSAEKVLAPVAKSRRVGFDKDRTRPKKFPRAEII